MRSRELDSLKKDGYLLPEYVSSADDLVLMAELCDLSVKDMKHVLFFIKSNQNRLENSDSVPLVLSSGARLLYELCFEKHNSWGHAIGYFPEAIETRRSQLDKRDNTEKLNQEIEVYADKSMSVIEKKKKLDLFRSRLKGQQFVAVVSPFLLSDVNAEIIFFSGYGEGKIIFSRADFDDSLDIDSLILFLFKQKQDDPEFQRIFNSNFRVAVAIN